MKSKTALASNLLLFMLALVPLYALAAHPSSEEEAVAMLQKAVAYMEENGDVAAFDAFNDPNGEFIRGDLYVFVFDMEGNYRASGANPKLVGSPASDLTDAEGNPVFKMMLEVANDKGEGSVEYVWLNPQTNQVEDKSSHIKKVGDYIVGVGHYD
jgi:cytochrome c